jgi:hypothetical protein
MGQMLVLTITTGGKKQLCQSVDPDSTICLSSLLTTREIIVSQRQSFDCKLWCLSTMLYRYVVAKAKRSNRGSRSSRASRSTRLLLLLQWFPHASQAAGRSRRAKVWGREANVELYCGMCNEIWCRERRPIGTAKRQRLFHRGQKGCIHYHKVVSGALAANRIVRAKCVNVHTTCQGHYIDERSHILLFLDPSDNTGVAFYFLTF